MSAPRRRPLGVMLAVLLGSITLPGNALQAALTPAACLPSAGPLKLDFALPNLEEKDVDLSSLRYKVLVVNFWATWCRPCRVEIPGLNDLYAKFRHRGLEVIGVAVDEPPATVGPYSRELKVSYPILIGRGRAEVEDTFGPLLGLPTTLVLNSDGSICKRHVGFVRKATLESTITALLSATSQSHD